MQGRHQVAHDQFLLVAFGEGWQAGGVGFEQGETGGGVAPDEAGAGLLAVGQANLQAVVPADDMVGGEDKAFAPDNTRRAEAAAPFNPHNAGI